MRKTNPNLRELINDLKRIGYEHKSPIWKDIGKRLEKPLRTRAVVNIARIDKYAPEDSTVVVPGKVLGIGNLSHRVNVAALSFSKQAREKIISAGGKIYTIRELLEKNPAGKNLLLLG